jgi:hypothetical protein
MGGCCCRCCCGSSSTADYGEDGPLSPTWSSPPTSPKNGGGGGGGGGFSPKNMLSLSPKNFLSPKSGGGGGGARRSFFGGRASARSSKAAQSAEMARLAAVEAAAQAEVERNKTVPEQVRGLVVNEYTEVDTIIRLLRLPNKPVRLARPRFFQRCLEKKEPMGCRQEIPDVAFLDTDKYTDDELRARLDVVAISYARLDPGHPDPNMFHLETIVKMLNCFTKGTEAKAKGYYRPQPYTSRYSAAQLKRMGYRMGAGDGERIVGVFMDWVSIYQDHPRSRRGPAVQQTPKEREASAAALENISVWYAHRRTVVWVLNYLPKDLPPWPERTDARGTVHPAAPRPAVDESGWPTLERRLAAFLTMPGDLLNVTLAKRETFLMKEVQPARVDIDNPDTDDMSVARAIAREDYVQLCITMMDRERGLPCLPGEFNDLIRTKRFTNDEPETGDRDVVAIPEYKRVFDTVIATAEVLSFADFGVGSEDALWFLQRVVRKGNCKDVRVFDMSNNKFGLSTPAWGEVLPEGMPALERFMLSNCGSTNGDVAEFAGLSNLQELRLDGTRVSGDVAGFRELKRLTKLYVNDTEVFGDLEAFGGLTDLEELVIATTKIGGNLSSLIPLKKLKAIVCCFTKVPLIKQDSELVGPKDELMIENPGLQIF